MNFSLIVRHKFWRLELKCQILIDPFSRVSHLHKLCIKRREFKQGNYKIVVLSTSCPRGKLIIYFRYNWRMHRATWYNLALILQSCHFHFTLCIHRSILPISRVFIPPAYHKMTVPCISESLGWHVKDSFGYHFQFHFPSTNERKILGWTRVYIQESLDGHMYMTAKAREYACLVLVIWFYFLYWFFHHFETRINNFLNMLSVGGTWVPTSHVWSCPSLGSASAKGECGQKAF